MSLINIYRISEESAGYNKVKPPYINNENCLRNFVSVFGTNNLFIFADNTSKKTDDMIVSATSGINPIKISTGSSGASFRYVYDWCINQTIDDDTIIYFVESDYIHRKNSNNVLLEGINLGSDFCTLYLHPDKFISAKNGGNPEIDDSAGEVSQVFKSDTCWWMLTGSTTMTFASKFHTLKSCSYTIRKHTEGTYPTDYNLFCNLRSLGKSLVAPIPSYSTHGETLWLSNPSEGNDNVIDKWKTIIESTI